VSLFDRCRVVFGDRNLYCSVTVLWVLYGHKSSIIYPIHINGRARVQHRMLNIVGTVPRIEVKLLIESLGLPEIISWVKVVHPLRAEVACHEELVATIIHIIQDRCFVNRPHGGIQSIKVVITLRAYPSCAHKGISLEVSIVGLEAHEIKNILCSTGSIWLRSCVQICIKPFERIKGSRHFRC